uniref:Maestro heat-like repeat-containing protein family member 2A n=1 Tax=Pogona vitticeps TaxID=103695 RepID=A0A6J0U959_9SAUR
MSTGHIPLLCRQMFASGLRWCLAYCAKGQLRAVLAALKLFEEKALSGAGFEEEPVCLHSGQGLPETARVRSALLSLYSCTVLWAPGEQLRAHLESRIVPGILRHYAASAGPQRAKDTELVLSFAQSVSEVSLSIQAHGETRAFRLSQKRALLDHLMDVLKGQPSEAMRSPACQEVLVALRHLSQVPERLCHEESMELAERCISHVVALPPSGLLGDTTQALYMETLAALSGLVETLLAEREAGSAGSGWFQQVFQLLGYWLVSEREWERARAMQVAARLLKARHQGGTSPALPVGQVGRLLGALGPSTCDPLAAIRQGAVECIEVLLSLPGAMRPPEPKGRTWASWLHCIQRDLQSKSTKEVRAASLQLAKVVSRALRSKEMVPFLRSLLEQLRTVNAACDQAVLWWFEVAARERGTDLKDKVRGLVAVLCSSLQWAEDPSLRRSLAQALCVLAEHHSRGVCASLVEQPLLQPRARRELWAAIVTHPSCRASALKHLLRWVMSDGSSVPNCVLVRLLPMGGS